MSEPDLYIPRTLDGVLRSVLKTHLGVLITGPRGVGKTRTGIEVAQSQLRLNDPSDRAAAAAEPVAAITTGRYPLLIDEWQLFPEILWAVKRAIDDKTGAGPFVITGSARTDLLADTWPGTGRLVHLHMWGLVGRERFGSAAAVPLFDRWDDEQARFSVPESPPGLRDYLEMALAGGLPDVAVIDSERERTRRLRAYADSVVGRDLAAFDSPVGRRRDQRKFRSYLRSYSLNTAGVVAQSTLARPGGIDHRTADGYLSAMEAMGIVDELPPWAEKPRKRLIIERVKRHFADVGLAAAAAGIGVDDAMRNEDLRGRFIDSFVTAQLRVEAEASGNVTLHHLRTANGDREIDVVAQRGLGLIGFEIKASSAPSRADARHLIWFRDEVAEDRFEGGVLFHTGRHRYQLDHGIEAVPIAGLWGPGLPESEQQSLL